MSRFLTSIASASISVIERLTFEKGDPSEEDEDEAPHNATEDKINPNDNITKPAPTPLTPTGTLPSLPLKETPNILPDESKAVPSPVISPKPSSLWSPSRRAAPAMGLAKAPDQPLKSPKDVQGTILKETRSTEALAPTLGGVSKKRGGSKVTVVGVGALGVACAQAVGAQSLCDELVLLNPDGDERELRRQVLDLQLGAAFSSPLNVIGATDYRSSQGSDLCLLCGGLPAVEGEDRASLIERNVVLLKEVVPALVSHSPSAVFLLVQSNAEVDVLTHAASKLSGLPAHRILGTGTNLDSFRLRLAVAEMVDVNVQAVQAYLIGEQGPASIPVWSSVSVGGVPLAPYLLTIGMKLDVKELKKLHTRVVAEGQELMSPGVGASFNTTSTSCFALAQSAAAIVKSILKDERQILSCSTLAYERHGSKHAVFLSLPCVLGKAGVEGAVEQPLAHLEATEFRKSAAALDALMKTLSL
eukprot:TRINITY_DN26426_c0_g1_i1.p1 TRINITY_DN26426_c0_g1~~TRINITY_DN26426_c0_g1_i1.p1  ORF type:complete len:473 (+),score=69.32 TRINITY_DN26426_c0_g1_i1:254-1672(+)